MQKSKLALSTVFIFAGLTSVSGAAFAQDRNACYMITSSGRRIDFDFCKKNPPVQTPKSIQQKVAISRKGSSRLPVVSFPASVNLQAFLRVIRYAEGTYSDDGYQIQFTGSRFYSFADHPRSSRCGGIRGQTVCSTAAGAYQFLETTWDDVASSIGASDFSPGWQDRGAIELIRRAGAMADVESGRVEDAIAKVSSVWASFPRWYGDYDGYYGQSVVPMEELVAEFRRQQIASPRAMQIPAQPRATFPTRATWSGNYELGRTN